MLRPPVRTGTVCGVMALSFKSALASAPLGMAHRRTHAYLVRLVIMTAIKVLVQERHETRVPSFAFDEARYVLDNVKGVDPLVALRPAGVFTRPHTAHVARLHEARVIVEDAEGVGERAVAEECRVLCVAEQLRESSDG